MLALAQHADALQHRGVGKRPPNVIADQAVVEEAVLSRLELFHLLVKTVALLPQLRHISTSSLKRAGASPAPTLFWANKAGLALPLHPIRCPPLCCGARSVRRAGRAGGPRGRTAYRAYIREEEAAGRRARANIDVAFVKINDVLAINHFLRAGDKGVNRIL